VTGPAVRLCRATLPRVLRPFAVHYWFVVDDGRRRRYEVWQRRDAGGESAGHVHRDLKEPEEGVGGGPAVCEAEWTGAEAERLAEVLSRCFDYPDRETYRMWPGPNSNTFVARTLGEAGIERDLDPRAVGKDWTGAGGRPRLGFGFETPLLGVQVGPPCGFELHVLGLTLGAGLRPPRLKTPLGNLGLRP